MANAKDAAPADKAEGKELEAAKSTALTVEDAFFEGSGEGMEDFSQSDFTVPFISIIQALSKAVQKNHANYVKGAEQGQFLNSATRVFYDGDKGLLVVPCAFQHRYIAWKPNNGGIAHDYGTSPDIYDQLTPNDKYQRIDPEGNEVVDAMEYFVLLIDPEAMTMEAAVIPFSGIHARKSKKWNNLIRAHAEIRNGKPVKPALYFYYYKFTTVAESNEKGSWYSFQIEDGGKLPDLGEFGAQVFNAAKELRNSVVSGELKAATEAPEAGVVSGDGDGAF
jgi:hypothetical protein